MCDDNLTTSYTTLDSNDWSATGIHSGDVIELTNKLFLSIII